MPQSHTAPRVAQSLERFLVEPGTGEEAPDTEILLRYGLGAYAATRRSVSGDGRLRSALVKATALHIRRCVELQRLLRAWQKIGIEVLLFKGFHLAEFVYPTPGARHYTDIDLLMNPRRALQAADMSIELGWQEVWHAQRSVSAYSIRDPEYHGHEVFQLRHERAGVKLDVHRRLVQNNHHRLRRVTRQERITRLTWMQSEAVSWGGVQVRLPHPLDAVLVGLILNRCWSPEDWQLRAHDYLDFTYLVEKYGLSLEQLRSRAIELGCPRTLDIFLQRCDPFERRCVLSRPAQRELRQWNLLISRERGNRYLQRRFVRFGEMARVPLEIARVLPDVVSALLLVHRSGSCRAATARLQLLPAGREDLDADNWRRLRKGIHRSFRLLGMSGRSSPELEAVALLAVLRRRSYAATLTWKGDAEGSAEVRLELAGAPLNVSGTLLQS